MLISAHAGYPRWLDSGADFLEIDIRRNREGVIVDSHDEPEPNRKYTAFDVIVERAAGRIGLHLDLKEAGFEIELVSRSLQRLPPDKVVVTADFESSARTIKQHFPHIRVSPIDFVIWDQRYEVRPAGKPIWIWTVDDKKHMEQLMGDPRIECIITNRPDLALKLRKARS